jgi:hypothetical protein
MSGSKMERVLPSPEEVLLAWLIDLPPGADPAEEAARELRRPGFRQPADPRIRRLRALLREVAEPAPRGVPARPVPLPARA